jgi:hypothetical protein
MASGPQVVQGCFVGGRPRLVVQPQRAGVAQMTVRGSSMQIPPNAVTFAVRGTGQRLPEVVQRRMEALFQTGFPDVRVHVGSEPASIGALAFSHGSDLYFAHGQYHPDTPHGQRLIVHELAHVVQQRAGRVRNPFGAGIAIVQDPGLEAEAERMGLRAQSLPRQIVAPVQRKIVQPRRILPLPRHSVLQRKTVGQVPIAKDWKEFKYSSRQGVPWVLVDCGNGAHLSFYPCGPNADTYKQQIDQIASEWATEYGVRSAMQLEWREQWMTDELPFDKFHVTVNGNHFYFSEEGHAVGENAAGSKDTMDEDRKTAWKYSGYALSGGERPQPNPVYNWGSRDSHMYRTTMHQHSISIHEGVSGSMPPTFEWPTMTWSMQDQSFSFKK